jgi:YebC/PmpR family DNA-binding regulatory protein
MPNDNIKRVLERAAGAGQGDNYESITYEGYGPSGVAVIVETMTDSRNRTAGNVRHHFDKYGGNMGASGCVAWNFTRKGVLVIDNEDEELEEDNVMMDALDAGAADFEAEDEVFTVYTDPDDFNTVADALTAKGYQFVSAQIEQVPSEYKKLENEEDVKNMEKLLDAMEDDDDVQNVWHNWDRD